MLKMLNRLLDPSEPKLHYYVFSFIDRVDTEEGSGMAYASVYMGYGVRDKINLARIIDAKEQAQVKRTATLMSVSYLGHMTQSEMKGELQCQKDA